MVPTRSSTGGPGAAQGAYGGQVRPLVALAWPAVLSYILNNVYRINDQFWIRGLGEKAQAAVGATFFVQIFNFGIIYLIYGGTLALVSRAVGAGESKKRDSVTRHALGMGLVLGALLTAVLVPNVGTIVAALGLEGEAAGESESYLYTLFLFLTPLALFPLVDAVFIARGRTHVPMLLQLTAVAMNYVLNPILIYGERASEVSGAPGVGLFTSIASACGIEGSGISGAALATGISRCTVVVLGLLTLRYGLGVKLLDWARPMAARMTEILRIGTPPAVSILVYAGAYGMLFNLVLTDLGDHVVAGMGIGFQVFEGLAFPCFLGVSMATASLVGRAIGARDRERVLAVVKSGRMVSRVLGLFFLFAFLFGGEAAAGLFAHDPAVHAETVLYVSVLAFSQLFVAVESVNEKVLLGSGFTGPILWISPLGNLMRVPLGWFLGAGGLGLGFGAVGVWWAINLTTMLKAFLFWRWVQRGRWLEQALPASDALQGLPQVGDQVGRVLDSDGDT